MSDPKRLFDGGTPLEQSILSFGRDEGPSDDLEPRMLAALARSRVKSSGPAPARWSKRGSIVLGIAAVGLSAIVGGLIVRHSAVTQPVATSGEHADAHPAKDIVLRRDSAGSNTNEPVVTLDALPNVAVPSSALTARPSATMSSESASIAREVELLDSVKAKLGSGDAAGAGRGLDAYDREFPRGTLRPEATVLRIRTLLALGDRAAAEKLGREFLAVHPTGVHAKRVRALLADEPSHPDK